MFFVRFDLIFASKCALIQLYMKQQYIFVLRVYIAADCDGAAGGLCVDGSVELLVCVDTHVVHVWCRLTGEDNAGLH